MDKINYTKTIAIILNANPDRQVLMLEEARSGDPIRFTSILTGLNEEGGFKHPEIASLFGSWLGIKSKQEVAHLVEMCDLVCECLTKPGKCNSLIKSGNPLSVYLGLWALGLVDRRKAAVDAAGIVKKGDSPLLIPALYSASALDNTTLAAQIVLSAFSNEDIRKNNRYVALAVNSLLKIAGVQFITPAIKASIEAGQHIYQATRQHIKNLYIYLGELFDYMLDHGQDFSKPAFICDISYFGNSFQIVHSQKDLADVRTPLLMACPSDLREYNLKWNREHGIPTDED